jgi:hypothetical protein
VIADLARCLQKTEDQIDLGIQELVHAGVCRFHAFDSLEIQERFWPYKRHPAAASTPNSEAYVAAIRRLFLRPGCVSSSFSAADERLAADWCHRGISFEQAERAICLGLARKYVALLNNGKGSPITSLSYFENLIEEVGRADVSPHYWRHVMQRMEQFEGRWRNVKASAGLRSMPVEETK